MTRPLEVLQLSIPDVVVVSPKQIGDARGYFMEVWHAAEFRRLGVDATFVQVNQSSSTSGTLRGLHYQIRRPQGKLVRVLSGAIFDVAVDLRRHSTSYGSWVASNLDSNERRMMWVPPGFAHGFYVTSQEAVVEYLCTDFYMPEFERTLAWNDAEIGVGWPLPSGAVPILSDKDSRGMAFRDAECFA